MYGCSAPPQYINGLTVYVKDHFHMQRDDDE